MDFALLLEPCRPGERALAADGRGWSISAPHLHIVIAAAADVKRRLAPSLLLYAVLFAHTRAVWLQWELLVNSFLATPLRRQSRHWFACQAHLLPRLDLSGLLARSGDPL